MIERLDVEYTRLPDAPGSGISDEQKTWLDAIVNNALSQIVEADPQHRKVHFALMVLTLEGVEEDGSHVVTSDTMTSMSAEYLHETLRDWVRKETQ